MPSWSSTSRRSTAGRPRGKIFSSPGAPFRSGRPAAWSSSVTPKDQRRGPGASRGSDGRSGGERLPGARGRKRPTSGRSCSPPRVRGGRGVSLEAVRKRCPDTPGGWHKRGDSLSPRGPSRGSSKRRERICCRLRARSKAFADVGAGASPFPRKTRPAGLAGAGRLRPSRSSETRRRGACPRPWPARTVSSRRGRSPSRSSRSSPARCGSTPSRRSRPKERSAAGDSKAPGDGSHVQPGVHVPGRLRWIKGGRVPPADSGRRRRREEGSPEPEAGGGTSPGARDPGFQVREETGRSGPV